MIVYSIDKVIMLIVILAADRFNANEDDFSVDGGTVVLSPAELVDMVWQEQMKKTNSSNREQISKNIIMNDQEEYIPEDIANDQERLKARKIWSRWSKWSKCSVTCGPGTFTRQRLCVAGRCAPGEREEQRRLCALAPCALAPAAVAPAAPHAPSAPSADQLHDDAE